MRRLAVISDVHGNIWALEAVLQDLSRRSVETILNLGDHLYGPLEPLRALELLQATPMVFIRGNCDRLLYEDSSVTGTMKENRESLSEGAKQWLREMPGILTFDSGLFLCHGTPIKDDVQLLEDIQPGGVTERGTSAVEALCRGIEAEVILCGHSHRPGQLPISGGRLVVNVGSVGLPAYTDELPVPHAMEAGSPHARYSILEGNGNGWKVQRIQVEYDWETASRTAARNGRNDWAEWLLTGRAKI